VSALVVLVGARSDGSGGADARVAAVSLVALVLALVSGWSALVPLSLALAGAAYGVQLALDDAPLDAGAPLVAAGLLVAAELAYWSLEERDRVPGDPGQGLRRVAFVAASGVGALLVGALLLALVDSVHARGLALDVAGAFAAAAALTVILLAASGRGRSSQ
jgi:hypothetical protein